MSVNQSGLRRTVSKSDLDAVSKGIRSADLIAGAFFLGLNAIGVLGQFTKVFAAYGGPSSGISFLYRTFCYPAAYLVSRFFSLKGDVLYMWIMAELVFLITALVLWLVIIFFKTLIRVLTA